jgi:F-type H+-transporting ATPase subunit b
VFLLKRFLFTPVLKAIDERESKIAHSIQAAEVKMEDAEKTRDLYQEKLEDLERQQAERMQELAEQIEQERQRKLALLKTEAETESDRYRVAIQTEADEFAQAFKRQLGTAVMTALERCLQDLSSQSLEQRMVETPGRKTGRT